MKELFPVIFGVLCVAVVYLTLSVLQLWRECRHLHDRITSERKLALQQNRFRSDQHLSLLSIVSAIGRHVGIPFPTDKEAKRLVEEAQAADKSEEP